MRSAVVAGWLVVSFTAAPASAHEWSLSAGRYNVKDPGSGRRTSLELGAELRLVDLELAHWFWGVVTPAFGVSGNTDGARYGYGGFRLDIPLGSRLRLGLQTVGGVYEAGDSFDLGGPIEFRSGLDIGVRLESEIYIGLSFHHLSNAGLYDRNPGVNSLVLTVSFSPERGR